MNRIFTPRSGALGIRALLNPLVILALFCACPYSANAVAQTGVDAVLVMDSSGSMVNTDPRRLRVPAARIFMSLLREQDRIGLISFSDNGYPVLHLTAPGADNNARILAAADKISSKGAYTNLYAALAKGVEMLDRQGRQDHEKLLVLMSDGKMDVGDTDEEWVLTQKVQGELLESVREKGIKVYTIAFTEASDIELLKDVAKRTGALFKLARTDKDLHEVFSAIFESAKDPDMLPIEGNRFVVDASIEEVTIVASKEREDVRIYLQAPDGSKTGPEDAGEGLKWFMSQSFDMITISKPQPGTWKLLSTDGRNRAYIVTNMTLSHNPLKHQVKIQEDMVLEAWLEDNGKLLDKEAVLTNTRFEMEITDPAGTKARFELFDQGEQGDKVSANGVYTNILSYVNPGAYQLSVIARGETFERQKTLHFEVEGPAPELAAGAEPVVAPESQAPAQPEPEAEPKPEPQPDTVAAEEPAAKKSPGLGMALGIFAGINLLLGGGGFGAWWFLKKRKKPEPVADDAEDEA